MEQKAILVGVCLENTADFDASMEELAQLAASCGIETAGVVTQKLDAVNTAHYIGPGKLPEIALYVRNTHADVVIFNDELSPSQIRNLEKACDGPVKDRTMLILDIFARRARTREARLQVETASLRYMLPRLAGMHRSLSQQTGGVGTTTRGAGEKLLELNRRQIQTRIARLDRELEILVGQRQTRRRQRRRTGIPVVSLVGYTNAGKSTLLNALLRYTGQPADKEVLEKDMLFATLETSVRHITLPGNRSFLLTDTVGFVRRLPHHLVKAFRSTLEEVGESDLLIHVVDCSSPEYREQIDVTNETLRQIGVEDIPVIYAFNKSDRTDIRPRMENSESVTVSARDGTGLDRLAEAIAHHIFSDTVRCEMRIPFREGETVDYLRRHAHILSADYKPDGTHLLLDCSPADYRRFYQYVQPEN